MAQLHVTQHSGQQSHLIHLHPLHPCLSSTKSIYKSDKVSNIAGPPTMRDTWRGMCLTSKWQNKKGQLLWLFSYLNKIKTVQVLMEEAMVHAWKVQR